MPKGRSPSMLSINNGIIELIRPERLCKCSRCKTALEKGCKCGQMKVFKAGFITHKRYCHVCVSSIIMTSEEDLAKIKNLFATAI